MLVIGRVFLSFFGDSKAILTTNRPKRNQYTIRWKWDVEEKKDSWYCRWKKSQTNTWDVSNPANDWINYQPQLVQDFFHQQYGNNTFFSSIFLSNFTTTKLDLIDWKIRKPKNWIWEDLLLGFSTVGVRVFWIVSPVPHFLGIWLLPFQSIKQVDFRYSMSIRNWSGFGINRSNIEKKASKCHLKGKKGAPVFLFHPPKKKTNHNEIFVKISANFGYTIGTIICFFV